MQLSRRALMQMGLLGMAGTAVGATAACSSSSSGGATPSASSTGSATSSAPKTANLALWYWGGGLSDKVVADAVTQFPNYHLKSQQIGGDFKTKLTTTMTGGKGVPDITGIKGEDIATFLPLADEFIDLNTLGADKLKDQYLPWKWAQATAADGKQVGFPIDIGPTAMFYREDLFKQAGLPSEPADVAPLVATWDDYFALGVKLKNKLPNTFILNSLGSVFGLVLGAGTVGFVDKDNKFTGDQDHIRKAWDTAIKPLAMGLDGQISGDDWNAAIDKGKLTTEIGAAWHALDISSASKGGAGKWRVVPNPGGPSNIGGSFLAIPKTSADPQAAFEVITWLLNADNQARGFTDAALFPSTPAAYKLPALTAPDPYFGGQKTIEVFGPQAEKIPVFYTSQYDAAVSAPYYNELGNVEGKGKDPNKAWTDAVSAAKTIAQRLGVS